MIRASTVGLVALREITERLAGRATWIVAALTTVLAIGLVVIPSLIGQPSGPTKLGLVGPSAQALRPALVAGATAAKVEISTSNVSSDTVARQQLTPSTKAGSGRLAQALTGGGATLDVALEIGDQGAMLVAYKSVPPAVSALIRAVLTATHQHGVLAAAGVPPQTIAASEAPVSLSTELLQPTPSNLPGLRVAALAAGFLLLYMVAGFGSAVASGVAQEKTSRTAELLIAAVRPPELMAGKVIGIGLVGLGQMTVTVGAAMIANAFVQSTNIPPELGTELPQILLWFVLGFSLYAFGFAAAGAMVARQEEVQSVSLPLLAVLGLGLILVYSTIATPDSPLDTVLSFLPPFSPVLMPARSILGRADAWQVVLAVVINLGGIAGMAILSARIYQRALVRGGARLSWGEALRLGRTPLSTASRGSRP